MTFYMWYRLLMTFIFCGRLSVWWDCDFWKKNEIRNAVFGHKKLSWRSDRKVSEAAGARWYFMLGLWANRFLLMEIFQRASVQILSGRPSTSKVTCFVLYIWNNLVHFFADKWWYLSSVAGTMFGEVGWFFSLFYAL